MPSKLTTESPASLRALAVRLQSAAKSLDETAEAMLLGGVSSIEVLHGPGTHEAITHTLEPFCDDARRKADKAIKAARAKRAK